MLINKYNGFVYSALMNNKAIINEYKVNNIETVFFNTCDLS